MATPKMHDEREAQQALAAGDVLDDLSGNEEVVAPAPAAEDTNIPEKYRGKTSAELVAQLQEQERFGGKQSSEIGELRKNVDSLIQAQLATVAAPAVEEAPVDFFDDPQKAIQEQIANHPSIKAAEASAAKHEKQAATSKLAGKHPDMEAILADEKFADWVKASPVRIRLFQSAHTAFDVEAADELFSTWKERKALASATVQVEETERKQQIKAASTGSSSASSANAPRKMYRRADVIRLMRDDPDRYRAIAGEIMQAYAEGRVIN